MSRVWDKVWAKKKVDSDYSLKLYDFLRALNKRLPKGARVLEAGCGSGQGLANFPGSKTFGLDISKQALLLAKRYTDNPVHGDIFRMPFPDCHFDLVYNSGVIEHFRSPQNLDAVREMMRVTKKGGRVVIIVPSSHCLYYRLFKAVSRVVGTWDFGYEEDYSMSRLRRLVSKAGLKVERFFGLQALPPFATNNHQALPMFLRKPFVHLEKALPWKEHYAYGLGVICRRR